MNRQDWLQMMDKIVYPVLEALSKEELREKLPTDFHPERQKFAMLEAFGRTVTGISPWLELETVQADEERALQEKYRQMVRRGLDHATDPNSKDYMNFSETGQPLVDAAFLSHGIIRAPHQLADKLPENIDRKSVV